MFAKLLLNLGNIFAKIHGMITRAIENTIKNDFNKGKVILILGPRQVGKTTLLTQLSDQASDVLSLNCDDTDDRLRLEEQSSTGLKNLVAGRSIILIDEAQRVKNIGLTLKILADSLDKTQQVIVTGSSSLELADEIYEPATGRIIEYRLYPFSVGELSQNTSFREERRLLESRLIYGAYPEVVLNGGDARRTLLTLANSYLYKDLLSFRGVRKPDILQKLVLALALQVGSEVSYNELSQTVGVDKFTVEQYIDLLEKCFVVFRLNSLSRNARNEIKKGKKVYFYDNGVRNAVMSNFAPLSSRTDVGALWENYLMAERMKANAYAQSYAKSYFWRTQTQQEIDYVEECDGGFSAFEFKWNPQARAKFPAKFSTLYSNSKFEVITPETYHQFLGIESF